MKSRISIVMPFKNAASTLPEALRSVLAQTFHDWELLAVDDHSEDGSAELVRSICGNDPRVRLMANAGPPGVVGASRTAGEAARAGWLARMDSDDISHPERLERQWNLTCARPELDVIGCGVEILSPLGEGMVRHVEWVNAQMGPTSISNARFIENPLVHPSSLMKKAAVDAAGGYLEVPWAEDHDLWLRLMERGAVFDKVPEALLSWRDSAGRLTRTDPRYGDDLRHRMRAHYLARMERVRACGVVVAGAGPIGKALARELIRLGVTVAGFFEVHPRRIGEIIHGAEVADSGDLGKRWREAVLLSAVGVPGGRRKVSDLARSAGYAEGEDFWCLC
ncbi:glycosyltransferase [Luteolibacter marinus]|uniref:glycosyltransferase n=1 Tax=Luteolibacter marinus TaxID=2776705 RepID=UPI001D02916E|nr:glycosyltransferase [Luteolibacter marinus]